MTADRLRANREPPQMPVVAAMRRWLDGEEPVPPLAEFFERYGQHYRRLGFASGHEAIRHHLDRLNELIEERWNFIQEYGFAVPSGEALTLLAAHAPLLEVGAGCGSWAKLLADRGVDIIATDLKSEAPYGFQHSRWYPVQRLGAVAAVRRFPERNVFCSWPSLGGRWLKRAAQAMHPGRTLIVVREEATADEYTWNYVESAFRHVISLGLCNWQSLHDYVEVWRKP
jgi:hypothetical protein